MLDLWSAVRALYGDLMTRDPITETIRTLRQQGKSVTEIAVATRISKRKLYKHWRWGR